MASKRIQRDRVVDIVLGKIGHRFSIHEDSTENMHIPWWWLTS